MLLENTNLSIFGNCLNDDRRGGILATREWDEKYSPRHKRIDRQSISTRGRRWNAHSGVAGGKGGSKDRDG